MNYQEVCKKLEIQKWTQNQPLISPCFELLKHHFTQNIHSGPNGCSELAHPIDFFSLFFDTEILTQICNESNTHFKSEYIRNDHQYSEGSFQYYFKKLNGIDVRDLRAYIAILIIMGITRIKGKDNYWVESPVFGRTAIPDIMPKHCFGMISAALRLTSEESSATCCNRIDTLCFNLSKRFQLFYNPQQELVIDESMQAMATILVNCQKIKRYNFFYLLNFFCFYCFYCFC